MAIDGYELLWRDRKGRKGGGVTIYVRSSLPGAEWLMTELDPIYEMLWVEVVQDSDAVTFIGAFYHPPNPIYQTANITNHVEDAVLRIQQIDPCSKVILARDFNSMSDTKL